jgi:hypothetical protein
VVGYVRELICKLGRGYRTRLIIPQPQRLAMWMFGIHAYSRACCCAILIALHTVPCLLASDLHMAANKHHIRILLQSPELAAMPCCPQGQGSFASPHPREDQSPHYAPSEKGVARPSPVLSRRDMLVVSISRTKAPYIDIGNAREFPSEAVFGLVKQPLNQATCRFIGRHSIVHFEGQPPTDPISFVPENRLY